MVVFVVSLLKTIVAKSNHRIYCGFAAFLYEYVRVLPMSFIIFMLYDNITCNMCNISLILPLMYFATE